MAIQNTIFKKTGTNTAVILAGANTAARWVGFFRFRMTENEEEFYGPCNVFRFVNKSGRKIRIRFGINIENGEPFLDIEPNSISNITVEDGVRYYFFDVENLDTSIDVAIGEFQYMVSVVEQLNEITQKPQAKYNKLGVF